MYGPTPGLKLLHSMLIYREMLKKSSSQELLRQLQPNLAENMPGRWGFRFVQIKVWPLLGPNKEHFDKSSFHEPMARMH